MLRCLIVLLLVSLAPGLKAMTVCYENERYWPYISSADTETSELPGLLVELVVVTAERLKIDLELQRMRWKRCLENLEQGLIDAAFAMIWTKERDSRYAFPKTEDGVIDHSRALWQGDYSVFVYKDSQLNWNGQTFSGVKYGLSAPPGYVAYRKLEQLGVLYQSELRPQNGLKMVSMGRLDGYVIERLIGNWMIREQGLENVNERFEQSFMHDYWFIPFSLEFRQNFPGFDQLFWDELATVRMEQQERLVEKYLNN